MNDVILHAFNWSFRQIANHAAEIGASGYGAVLFPPPFYSLEDGLEWWQIYQPKDYRILRSHLGRKADLVAAIEALKAAGVRSYVDVVFNHMANEDREDHFCFPGRAELERYAREREAFEADKLYGNLDEGLFDEHDFHPKLDITDWDDSEQSVTRSLSGLPDLVLSIAVVKEQLRCLEALVALGFEGFRVDALKHLPIDHINSVFRSAPLRDKFLFGEMLTFDREQNDQFLWPLLHQTHLPFYDFPLQQTMLRAFRPGGSLRHLADPSSSYDALPWSRSVTFTVTHDVPNNDGFRGMLLSPHDEYLANSYILGRDGGVPLLYTDHGESSQKFPEDAGMWEGLWNRPAVVGMVSFHNAVHGLAQRSIRADHDLLVFARGDRGIVAINKSTEWATLDIGSVGLRHGHYRCQIHKHEFHLNGDAFALAIPPRQTQMWLCEG